MELMRLDAAWASLLSWLEVSEKEAWPLRGEVLTQYQRPDRAYHTLSHALRVLGDAVAVYTDGLTEVGPIRTALLGVEGIAALLEAPFDSADALASRLIAGVKAFDKAAARDDLCLLVGVIKSD